MKYHHADAAMTIGEKRNLAIREYATGELIANFDDDDIYFPAYLTTMVKALQASSTALIHLAAWTVLDIQEHACATFDRSAGIPTEQEAAQLSRRCGFCMVYTYQAWRSVPWPHTAAREDVAFLHGFADAGLPVTSRSESAKPQTVLHVQHPRSAYGSVCTSSLAEGTVEDVYAKLTHFEEACRRILGIPIQEYNPAQGLLHPDVRSPQPRSFVRLGCPP
eukprot:5135403-Amphidinium_carterae.1